MELYSCDEDCQSQFSETAKAVSPTGNRVRKVRYKYTGSDPDPVFVTEGSNPSWALQSDEFYVRDVSGKEIAIYSGSSLTQWNIWGLDNVGKINADTTRNYYLKDHLGSIRVVLNSTNGVVSAQDYDCWGYVLENRSYNSSAMKYDFTGKERDDETSYDYFGSRYYDSRIGRWTATEPLINKYPGFSLYCYTLNNPVILTDPTGMWIPNFDPNTNKITVIAEEGDNLQDLYSQLGISADDFAKTYDINSVNEYSVVANETSFDITNFVLQNSNFDPNNTNSNCHGFVSVATGQLSSEQIVNGFEMTSNLGALTEVPKTGVIGIFEVGETINFNDRIVPKGEPAHSGIYLLKSKSGEIHFLNRLNTNLPVTIKSKSEIIEYYKKISDKLKESGVNATISNEPKYYNKKD